ncbi:thioredoxin [Oscillospiraceae bacterium N12]|jgi:thioredoxin 1|uniref:Thioredoxin n=1 Tax=Jilunia laotingensis TaxID=2763675 RepID=A0A926IQN6_9BACT|nr:thioredoxin [Jilunia laotingensis]MBC8594016.1 thioredoxin [Jilunia laotingensis]
MKLIKTTLTIVSLMLALSACASNANENNENINNNKKETNMSVIHLTKAEFLKKVYNFEANPNEWKYEGDKPAIIDFYATWCGPCKAISPVLEELAKEYDGKIYIYKIDVDQEKDLASAFGIRSIPTLIFAPMGKDPQVIQGALPKDQLKKAINDVLLSK